LEWYLIALTPVNEIAISLPFKIDSFGTISATVNQSKIWQDRVRSVIGTALGERVYRPGFGCDAANKIYETEEYLMGTIEQDIKTAFQKFLPLLSLDSIEVSLEDFTRTIFAEVTYSTSASAQYLIKVGIASIDGTNTLQEDILWQTR
jgi:phage baseplate assembly protein W